MDPPARPGAAATAGPSFPTTTSHTRRASTPSQADATTPRHLYAAAHSVAASLGAPAGPAAYSRFDPSSLSASNGGTSPLRRLSELARARSASSQSPATGDASAPPPPPAPMILNRRTSDLGGAPAYMWSSSTSYGRSTAPLGMGLGMSWRTTPRGPPSSSSSPVARQASLSTIAASLCNASGDLADDTVDAESRPDPDSPYAVSPAVSGHHLSTRAHSPAQTPTPGTLFGSMDLIAGAETARAGHRRSMSEASHRLNLSGPVRPAAATPLSAAFRLPSPVELELVDLQGMFLRQQFRATQLERQLNECRATIGTVVQYAEQRAQSASTAPSPTASPNKPVAAAAAAITGPADASTGDTSRRMTVEQQELALLRNVYQHLFAHLPHRDENVVLQDQVANLERQVEWLESALAQEQYLRVAAQMQNAEGAAWRIEEAAEQMPADPLVKLELEVDRLSRENRALVAAFQTQQTASANGAEQWALVPASRNDGGVGLGLVDGQESEKKRTEEELTMVLREVETALGIDGLLDCPAHHLTDKLTAWKDAHDHALVEPLKALVPTTSTDDIPPMSPTAIAAAAASRLTQLHQSTQTMTMDLARLREHLHRTRTSSRVEIETLQRTVSAHEEGLVSEDERRRVLTSQIDALTRTRDDLTQQLDRANEQVSLQAMKLARLEATVAHTNDTVAQAQDALAVQTLAAANVKQELDRAVAMRADVEDRLQAQAAEWDAQRAAMVAAVKDAERKAADAARELGAAQAQLAQRTVDGSAYELLQDRIRDLEDQVGELKSASAHFQAVADQRSRDLVAAQAELQALRDQLSAAMKKVDEQHARLVEAAVHSRTRAERIAVLENELQTAQATLVSAREEGAAERARHSAELESMGRMNAAQADELRVQVEALQVHDRERAELLAQVATSTEAVRRTEAELATARTSLEGLETDHRDASTRIHDLEMQLATAVSDRETTVRRAGERQMEWVRKLDAEVRQRSRAEAQVAELEQELARVQGELRRLLAQSETDADRESALVATLNATIADLHAQGDALRARIETLEHDCAKLESRRADMEQRYQLEIEDLTAQLATARQDRQRLETDLAATKDELTDSQQAARDSASRAADFELVLDQANADLEAAQESRDQALAEVQRLSEQWAQACEREADDKVSAESALQETRAVAERATMLVRDREAQLKAMQADLDHSLAVGAALREQTAALRVELDGKVEELVESDARVRDLEEELSAVQAETKTAALDLAERDARVRHLEKQLSAVQAETKSATLELAQARELLQAKSCEYQETVGELRLELEGSETKSYEAHAATEEVHRALDAARAQVADLEAQVGDLEAQLADLDTQVEVKSEIIATSGLEIQDLRARVATLEQQHADAIQAHQTALTALKKQHADAVQVHQAALSDLERRHADAVQTHQAALAAEHDAAAQSLTEIRAELARKTAQCAEAMHSLAQMTAEYDMAIQRHAEAQVQLDEHAKKIAGLTNALDRMRGHAKRLSSDVESLEAEKQQIADDLNRQLETLEAANKECREQRDALEAEVTTLRIQMDEARDGAARAQRTTVELRHQVKELQTTKCTLANEVDAITTELACVSQARDEARREVGQLQARLGETRRTIEAEYAEQLKQAHDELATVIEARSQSWTELNAARAEVQRKDEAVNMLREQLEAVSAQADTLAKQVEELTEEEHRFDSTMSHQVTLAHDLSEQLAETNSQLAAAAAVEQDLREQLMVAKADAAQSTKKVASAQRQNQEAQSRVDVLEEQIEHLEAKLGDTQLALQEAQYRAMALESMLADKAHAADKAMALEAELGVSQLAHQEAQYRATAFESMLADKARAADTVTALNDKLQAVIQKATETLGVPGTSDLADVLATLRDLLVAGNGSIVSHAESIASFLQFVRLNLELPETASLREIKTSFVAALECADKAHMLDNVQRRLFATHFPVDQFADWVCCAVSDGVGVADELQKMERRCRFAEKQLRATSSALEGERASLDAIKSQIAAIAAAFGCDTVDANPRSILDALANVRQQDLQHIEDMKRRIVDLTAESRARQVAVESIRRCASLLGISDGVDGAVVCRELARFQEDYDAVVKEADELAVDVKVWRDAWSALVDGMAQVPGLSVPRDADPAKVAVAVLDALRNRQDDRGLQDEELAVAGQVWHREVARLARLVDSTASGPLAVAQAVHDALVSARHVQERIRACCQSAQVAEAAQPNKPAQDGDVQAHLAELEQFIRDAVKHRAAIRQLLADFPDLETDDLTTAVIQLAQRARHELAAPIRDDESESDVFNRTLEARFDHLVESMSPVLSRSGRAKSPDDRSPIPCRDCQSSRMKLAQIENQVQRQAAELEKVVAFAHRLETQCVKASAELGQTKVAVQDVYERLQHFSRAHQDAQRAHRQTSDDYARVVQDLREARAALDERVDRAERDSVSPSAQHSRCCLERDQLHRQLQEQAVNFQEYRAKYHVADAAAWDTLAARIRDLGTAVTKATELDQAALNTLLAEESRVRKDAQHLRDALAKTQRLLIQVETETKAATADLVADHQRQVDRADRAWEQRLAEMIRLKDQLIAEKNDQVRHLRKEALRAHEKLQRKMRECRCPAAVGPDAVSLGESVAAATGSHSLSSSTAPRSSYGLSFSRHYAAERDRAPAPERLARATAGRNTTTVVQQSAMSSTASLTSSISKTLETLERLG
ncbi:hypothetical protein GGF32_002143 [Allomyces javanicus]|nr:hypothetical protein GGF32_002143 [Allomyces javanicus]